MYREQKGKRAKTAEAIKVGLLLLSLSLRYRKKRAEQAVDDSDSRKTLKYSPLPNNCETDRTIICYKGMWGVGYRAAYASLRPAAGNAPLTTTRMTTAICQPTLPPRPNDTNDTKGRNDDDTASDANDAKSQNSHARLPRPLLVFGHLRE
jgi:hypothetical protein